MTFDIYALDQLKTEDWEGELETYIDNLVELFEASPEWEAHAKKYAELGSWTSRLVDLGFVYQEVTVPQMLDSDIETLLFRIFPRKISVLSSEDVDDTISELIAFWTFLKRTFNLSNADEILTYLNELDPEEFKAEMNNPENFGMARSFVQAGIDSGFDMSNEEGLKQFQAVYNNSLKTESPIPLPLQGEPTENWSPGFTHKKKLKTKEKRRRALAKDSRKRNRKKRKK